MEQTFGSVGVRIDGPRAWDEHLVLSWVITDEDTTHITELRNGTLNQREAAAPAPGSTTSTLSRLSLIQLVASTLDLGTASPTERSPLPVIQLTWADSLRSLRRLTRTSRSSPPERKGSRGVSGLRARVGGFPQMLLTRRSVHCFRRHSRCMRIPSRAMAIQSGRLSSS